MSIMMQQNLDFFSLSSSSRRPPKTWFACKNTDDVCAGFVHTTVWQKYESDGHEIAHLHQFACDLGWAHSTGRIKWKREEVGRTTAVCTHIQNGSSVIAGASVFAHSTYRCSFNETMMANG